ncbi:MAG: VOC family protein [Porphyrobacter sp.]|nr:VOC family protein [Porphyrobacter sp.]
MPKIETYRKRAKQIVRWHRERNYSVGGKVRQIERFRHLKDAEVLAMPLPLALAQEVVAIEGGFADWAALKASLDGVPAETAAEAGPPRLEHVIPILFVRDVAKAAAFYVEKLGFTRDFLHGNPPFYGAVSRDAACLHLRLVHEPNFAALAARERSLILASIEVANVKALFEEFDARRVRFPQPLQRQAWGGLDFQVEDPDGNRISFVTYDAPGGRG